MLNDVYLIQQITDNGLSKGVKVMKLEVLENVIGVQEAAEIWGMGADRVKALAQSGEIYAKKIGNTWVIDKYQRNPRRYNRKNVKATHYEGLKLNVPEFEGMVFTKNPFFEVVENFEDGTYTVDVYFVMKVILDGNTSESMYSARKLLMDFNNGDDLDISFEYEDLLRFDDDFIRHIDVESTKVAKRCRENFLNRL